jgi:ADP-ribosyl-[dinitrogen reductase] hydrolase
MALCLADSLINCQGFKPADQMYRYFRWYDDGFMSPLGYAYGIGRTVHNSMQRFIDTAEPFSGSTDPSTAGNGSIMRLAPVPMLYRKLPEKAIHYAGESSRTTHGAPDAVAGCQLLAYYLLAALNGESKGEILTARRSVDGLSDPIRAIALGSFAQLERAQVKSSGYVVDTLEAAMWAFAHSESFAEGALLAVNLGGDTDTIAAVYGQLAGAHYGLGGIPAHWHEEIVMHDIIYDTATELYKLSEVIN